MKRAILSGVTQGSSVLGSILFLFDVNGLLAVVGQSCFVSLADNTEYSRMYNWCWEKGFQTRD